MLLIGYIHNVSTRFKVFVANRIQRIYDESSPKQWFHVNSAENPADDGSHAVFPEHWLKGPGLLRNPDLTINHITPTVSPDDVEVKCMSSQGDESQETVHVHTF